MVLFGILLLVVAIPTNEKENEKVSLPLETVEQRAEISAEEALEEILGKVAGVGRVEVYIRYGDRGTVVVEKDENTSEEQVEETDRSGGKRKTTTIQRQQQTIYGDQEVPLVVQELLPAVEGILVVAEGGGNEAVKKQIEKTMMALFGLEAHKISIMKMEVTK